MLVADEEYLGEDAGDIVAQRCNKPGDSGEVRPAVAGQRDKGDVFAAGAPDAAAADNAHGVREQDNLQKHGGRIGGCPRHVVAVTRIETREIEFVVDQVVHGMFEGAGQKLLLQVDGEKAWAGVDVFVARHLLLQNINFKFDLDIYFGSRQDARMKILFLQLR